MLKLLQLNRKLEKVAQQPSDCQYLSVQLLFGFDFLHLGFSWFTFLVVSAKVWLEEDGGQYASLTQYSCEPKGTQYIFSYNSFVEKERKKPWCNYCLLLTINLYLNICDSKSSNCISTHEPTFTNTSSTPQSPVLTFSQNPLAPLNECLGPTPFDLSDLWSLFCLEGTPPGNQTMP